MRPVPDQAGSELVITGWYIVKPDRTGLCFAVLENLGQYSRKVLAKS